MDDLYTELQAKTKQLDMSVRQLRKSGTECLKLRDEGTAIGLIDKVCYGIPSVAEARFRRDVAEAVYKANQEAINSIKLQMRLMEGQINREWGSNGVST